jgi:hypothetical protein
MTSARMRCSELAAWLDAHPSHVITSISLNPLDAREFTAAITQVTEVERGVSFIEIKIYSDPRIARGWMELATHEPPPIEDIIEALSRITHR